MLAQGYSHLSGIPGLVFPASSWAGWLFHVSAALVLAAHPPHLPAWPWFSCCSERLPWALGPCTVTVVPLPGLVGFAGLFQREIWGGKRAGLGQTPLEASLRLQHVWGSGWRTGTEQGSQNTPSCPFHGAGTALQICSYSLIPRCNYAIKLSSAIIPSSFLIPALNKVHLQSI